MKVNINHVDGIKSVEVIGKPFEMYGYKWFFRKGEIRLIVSEWSTGYAIASGGDETECFDYMKRLITRVPDFENKLNEKIKTALQEYGVVNK